MYLNNRFNRAVINRTSQQGSMLVIALFVIVVLALLGLTMTRLLSSSSEAIVHEILGQRALNAARAGINCALTNSFGSSCSHLNSMTFTDVTGLENCSYEVTQTTKTINESGVQTYDHLAFTSKGECSVGNIIVTRNLYVDAVL